MISTVPSFLRPGHPFVGAGWCLALHTRLQTMMVELYDNHGPPRISRKKSVIKPKEIADLSRNEHKLSGESDLSKKPTKKTQWGDLGLLIVVSNIHNSSL